MSDLIRRLRDWQATYNAPERVLMREAADRIEADEALLRQALEAFDGLSPDTRFYRDTVSPVVAAIRARMNGQAEET